MFKEIIQRQYNVLLQSIFFDDLVGKNFVNAFVMFMGKCWNKWNGYLRYERIISLELQAGITSQISKWANTDPRE
jgi:hypothetical protein